MILTTDIEAVNSYITKHVAKSGVNYAWERLRKELETIKKDDQPTTEEEITE